MLNSIILGSKPLDLITETELSHLCASKRVSENMPSIQDTLLYDPTISSIRLSMHFLQDSMSTSEPR